MIKSYTRDGINRNFLFKSDLFKTKQVELSGFEDDFNLCNRPTLNFNHEEIICISGDVGVHSQAISFARQDLSIVKINDGGTFKYSFTTDVPSYQILDYNNDGYDDLIIDNRDYDKNPLADVSRLYYSGGDDSFIFDKKEGMEVK